MTELYRTYVGYFVGQLATKYLHFLHTFMVVAVPLGLEVQWGTVLGAGIVHDCFAVLNREWPKTIIIQARTAIRGGGQDVGLCKRGDAGA